MSAETLGVGSSRATDPGDNRNPQAGRVHHPDSEAQEEKKREYSATDRFRRGERPLSTETQAYDPTSIINEVRQRLALWRTLPSPFDWQVTPETARLLQHWRSHKFNSIRPFFCQIEAVEAAVWLIEVAPQAGKSGKALLEHLVNANNDANPSLIRLALKLATAA